LARRRYQAVDRFVSDLGMSSDGATLVDLSTKLSTNRSHVVPPLRPNA
jgi:hypothetical protein